LDDFRRNFS